MEEYEMKWEQHINEWNTGADSGIFYMQKTERKLERETENVADVPTNFVSRNKLCRSNFMIQVEGGPHVFT
jgi:hypothetical protein